MRPSRRPTTAAPSFGGRAIDATGLARAAPSGAASGATGRGGDATAAPTAGSHSASARAGRRCSGDATRFVHRLGARRSTLPAVDAAPRAARVAQGAARARRWRAALSCPAWASAQQTAHARLVEMRPKLGRRSGSQNGLHGGGPLLPLKAERICRGGGPSGASSRTCAAGGPLRRVRPRTAADVPLRALRRRGRAGPPASRAAGHGAPATGPCPRLDHAVIASNDPSCTLLRLRRIIG